MSDGRHGKDEAGLIARLRAELQQVTAERDKLQRHLEAREELDAMLMAETLPRAADGTGPLPRVPAQRQPADHRAPKKDRHLWIVPVFVAALAGLRWAWHAHRAATAVAGGVLTLTAATTTAAVVTTQPAHGPGRAAAVASAPAGIDWSATPVLSPSSIVRAAAWPHLDAGSSRKRPVTVPAVVVPAPPPPPVSVRPSAPYSPPAAPAPPPLSLSATRLDLGVYLASQPGALTISDEGDAAVAWTATCSADVSLTPSQGFLTAGQQGVPVTVRINPADGASSGWCDFTPGNERLVISWTGAGSPSSAS